MFDLSPDKFHNKRMIKIRDKKEIEPQEIFLDSIIRKKIEKTGLSDNKIEIPLSRKCFFGLLLFSFVVFSALFVKSFQLVI